MKKTIYKIKGFDCASCATLLEMDFEDAGFKVSCSYTKETIEVEGDHDTHKIVEVVKKSGYTIVEN